MTAFGSDQKGKNFMIKVTDRMATQINGNMPWKKLTGHKHYKEMKSVMKQRTTKHYWPPKRKAKSLIGALWPPKMKILEM